MPSNHALQICRSFFKGFSDLGRVRHIIIRMGFESFLVQLQTSGWPQAVCLGAQVAISGFVFANIRRHCRRFPIKQLSPICTLFALAAFLVINLLSVAAREIEQSNGYYRSVYSPQEGQCGQCRIYGHPQLKFITLAYNALRDLPLVVFALKTVRVSICFLQPDSRELPKWAVSLLCSEWRIVGVSSAYVGALFAFSLLDMEAMDGMTAHAARQTFQLLCPKQSGVLDWVATVMRYVLLAVSYSLSIKAYKQLDFKRFLFLIFLLSNTQGVVRAALVLAGIVSTTYHEFYYHSLLLNLLGTLLLLPYSEFNLNINQPPGAAVLQNFQAFINYLPGSHILRCFALHRDHQEATTKYSDCFEACLALRKIKMEVTLQSSLIANYRAEIKRLLGSSEIAQHIETSRDMREKISREAVQLSDVRKLERQLLEFCDLEIFRPWKKTESRDYVEKEFRDNMVIDEKMKQLGVEIGA